MLSLLLSLDKETKRTRVSKQGFRLGDISWPVDGHSKTEHIEPVLWCIRSHLLLRSRTHHHQRHPPKPSRVKSRLDTPQNYTSFFLFFFFEKFKYNSESNFWNSARKIFNQKKSFRRFKSNCNVLSAVFLNWKISKFPCTYTYTIIKSFIEIISRVFLSHEPCKTRIKFWG